MSDQFDFVDVLNHYVRRAAYTPGQMADLSGLPKSTIVNWLRGRVAKPREWQSIARLMAILRLDETEANEVLEAAGHPSLATLQELADEEDRDLLQSWQPRESASPTAVPARPPFQAIADAPYLMGREEELRQLSVWLRAGEVCVIQGLPGVGKTALAARLAYRLRSHFGHGVLWASPATSNAMVILDTFARAYRVDVSELSDVASRSRVVRNLLADKQALLVLDDVEESAQVEALLPPSGPCAVLITTRRQNLRVARGAHRLTLRPFSPSDNATRRLFAHVLGEERVRAEADLFAEIADLLGHLPLALLIVASRLAWEPGWETAVFLHRLRKQRQRLGELAYEGERVDAAFALSTAPLSDIERRFFAALSTFAGDDFGAEAAAAGAGLSPDAAQDHLRALYARSLVQTPRPGRYTLHPLLRDHARALLDDEGVAERLANYYLHYLEDSVAVTVVREEGNIIGVLDLTWQGERYKLFCDLVLAFVPHLRRNGRLDLAHDLLSRATDVATGAQAIACQLHLAAIARRRHRYNRAEAILARIAALLPEHPAEKGAFLVEKGTIAACRGNYSEARTLLQQALPLVREAERPALLISLLKELGVAQVAQSDYEKGEASYKRALTLARQKAPAEAPTLLRCLGGLAVAQERDYERAYLLYQEALELVRNAGVRPALAILLNNLAATAVAQNAHDKAREWLEEGLDVARQTGEQVVTSMILTNLGRLALAEGKFKEGRAYFQEAVILAEAVNRPEIAAASRAALAHETKIPLEESVQLTIIFD